MALAKRIVLSVLLVLTLTFALNPRLVKNGVAWSNGGYSSNPANPDYGTHDWIAQHALDWLPGKEKSYIMNNTAAYLYGTELPDNGQASDGIGDTSLHHIYFYSTGILQDDAAAVRATTEFYETLTRLASQDYQDAAKHAGIMTHYIADMAVFAHVMGAATVWGAETHHSDYENYVNTYTSSYNSTFNTFLEFDGYLDEISPYDAATNLARDTTIDNMTYTAVWMDQHYNWSNTDFRNRAGQSLNLAVNYVADVLHSLYIKSVTAEPLPPEPPYEPFSNQSNPPPPPSFLPSLPQVNIPLWTVGAAVALMASIVIIAVARRRPKQPHGKLVR